MDNCPDLKTFIDYDLYLKASDLIIKSEAFI